MVKEEFETFYASLFGQRWNELKRALTSEGRYQVFSAVSSGKEYFIDPASVFVADQVAQLIAQNEEQSYLDLCAAPGGKFIACMQGLQSLGADAGQKLCRAIANDSSASRRFRLKRNLEEFLPRDFCARLHVTSSVGESIGRRFPHAFDLILVDAPCSSEGHLLGNTKAMKNWSPKRIKRLSNLQRKLLTSAFFALREGGHLIYATCAINEQENDENVLAMEKKFPELVGIQLYPPLKAALQKSYPHGAEHRTCGAHLYLPDKSNGLGPLFFKVWKKRSHVQDFSSKN